MFSVLEQTKSVSTCTACLSSETAILNDYIPTFRFGVLSKCRAVSISINPAENQRGYRPLPRFADYGIAGRSELTEADLTDVALRSDEYFTDGNKHRFFNTLQGVASEIDSTLSYQVGSISHIDVVACVTRPKWNGVPPEQRQSMLENCRQHFLMTLRLVPSHAWLLCDGRTALEAIEHMGGQTERKKVLGHGLVVCIGNLLLADRAYQYVGWNFPAHKLYGRQSAVGTAARHLMDGNTEVPPVPSPQTSSPSCIPSGMTFASQHELMQYLVRTLGKNKSIVCREYANAERRGLVLRTRNKSSLSPEQYAKRLYDNGIYRNWL